MKSKQEQKIENALTDLIDNIERFYGVAPLRMLEIGGGNDDIGCFTFLNEYKTKFNRFESWFQHLMETLDPWVRDDEKDAKAAEKIIDAIIPEDDEEVKQAWRKLRDGLSGLQYPARRVGYIAGFICGARFQGASRADLVRIGEAVALISRRQWKGARADARAKRKGEAKKTGGRARFKLVDGGKKDQDATMVSPDSSGPETLKGEFNL
jgi:hypothetical protein